MTQQRPRTVTPNESPIMNLTTVRRALALLPVAALVLVAARHAPPPAEETAYFAGGCFWGVDAVYKHVKGVSLVESGYSGGTRVDPSYEQVSSGMSGHAESVRIVYDPSKVSYNQLLRVFFVVAHDPTQLNRQGPDHGTQYRSAIFYANETQHKEAQAFIDSLTAAKTYKSTIVTQVVAFKAFYKAEAYHQNYLALHPDEPYIIYNDAPKLVNLKKTLPELYSGK